MGKTKTRIAISTGDPEALKIYKELTDITRQIVEKASCLKHVFYSDYIDDQDRWDNVLFTKNKQTGANLGERMKNAFNKIFQSNSQNIKVIIIGSDCPYITTALIESAFTALDNNHVVIGPATDGGYYLLGMSAYFSDIFEDISWSSDSVFSDTIKIVNTKKLSYHTLPTLSDIDTIQDWIAYKNGK